MASRTSQSEPPEPAETPHYHGHRERLRERFRNAGPDALGDYVKRPDVPDKLRIDVLRTIGGLSGAVATTALVDYVASVPAKEDRASKKEAQKLLDERGTSQ